MIRIKEIEHAADAVTHQIFDFLNTTFITPFDREDIITLAKEMDDVVDYINAAAQKIHLYKPKNGLKQYEPFCEMIKECTNEIRLAVVELPSIKNPKTLERICIRINEIENHTDLLFDKTISRLFETETDAVELIKHKEITQTLEKVTDSAERVADAIKRIIVKLA
jgi:predicted phosphate transport protein (TIGR00153 family)